MIFVEKDLFSLDGTVHKSLKLLLLLLLLLLFCKDLDRKLWNICHDLNTFISQTLLYRVNLNMHLPAGNPIPGKHNLLNKRN